MNSHLDRSGKQSMKMSLVTDCWLFVTGCRFLNHGLTRINSNRIAGCKHPGYIKHYFQSKPSCACGAQPSM